MDCDFIDLVNNKKCNLVSVGHQGDWFGMQKSELKEYCNLKPDENPVDNCPQFIVFKEAKQSKLRR